MGGGHLYGESVIFAVAGKYAHDHDKIRLGIYRFDQHNRNLI